MTPLPKRRWSTRRQGKRRATYKATSLTQGKCDHCGALKTAFVACPSCGFYNGFPVLKIKVKGKKGKTQAQETLNPQAVQEDQQNSKGI